MFTSLDKYVNKITGNPLTETQQEQFQIFYERMTEKNKVMNLTAITEPAEVELKHYIDSVALAEVFPEIKTETYQILDLGTGAGFPGLPLKLVFPQHKVTLFDSLNKRVVFLQEIIDALGLKKCEALHGRAEECARKKELREHFDLVVSRAVANLSVLAEYCLPFVKKGGYFIAYKTADMEEELSAAQKAISLLGGTVEKTEVITLPDSDIRRSFLIIKKTAPTPKAYPRKAGTASKKPL